MICQPCKDGVHQGDLAEAARQFASMNSIPALVCPGDTWCDCQHKTPVERVMKEKVDRWTVGRGLSQDLVIVDETQTWLKSKEITDSSVPLQEEEE